MNKTRVFAAACAGMGFFGVAMLSLGPILAQLDQAVPGATALPATLSVGIIVGTLIFGPIVDRFGYKWLLIASALMALAGVQGLAYFQELHMLHCSIFMLGVGGGVLNGETNALVSDIYVDPQRGARLGVLGAFYCIGALLWTLLNYFMPDYHLPLGIVSAIMLLFIVYFCLTTFPRVTAAQKKEAQTESIWRIAFQPMLLTFALILFFQSGFEGITGSFAVTFLQHHLSMVPAAATLSLTWFTIGMMAGRLPLGAIMLRLRKMGTLYLYLSVALAGVLLLMVGTSAAVVYAAMALIGFGVGATYPVVVDYIASAYSHCAGTALSAAMFIGLLGQFTFNKCIGLAFDQHIFHSLPMALIGAVAVMMVLLPMAVNISKRSRD